MTSSLTSGNAPAPGCGCLALVLAGRAIVNLSQRGAARQGTLGMIRAQLQVGPVPSAQRKISVYTLLQRARLRSSASGASTFTAKPPSAGEMAAASGGTSARTGR